MRTLGRKSWIALGGLIFGILPWIVIGIAWSRDGGEFNGWAMIGLILIAIPIMACGLVGMLSGYFAYEVAAVGGPLRGWITFMAIPASLAACLFYMFFR